MNDSNPRVLQVVDSLGVGGTERVMATLVESTSGLFQHSICAIREGGATATRLERSGVQVRLLGKRTGNDWKLVFRIAALCRELRPDIVHTRNWGSIEAIIGARLARVPVVIHGEHGRHAGDVDGRNQRQNRLRRGFALFADRVVTVCDYLRSWLETDVKIASRKIEVVRNGVDIERFSPRDRPLRLRCEWGVGEQEVLVGTVGRLDAVKDQLGLVEAMANPNSNLARVRVVIAGEGPERPRLEKEIKRRGLGGRVLLLGHREDTPDVLRGLDVFVLPSLGEGMCNTILEAMASGLPVVATRVGGNPELVVKGVTGSLVPPGDRAALRAAIEAYVGDESMRLQHGASGRARVLQDFTQGRMIDDYVSLYRAELRR